jgi:hypothetical protein
MKSAFAALAMGLLLQGSAGPGGSRARNDNVLMQERLRVVSCDSAAFSAVARAVPANQFGHRMETGAAAYYYYAPMVCGSVYIGTHRDWST